MVKSSLHHEAILSAISEAEKNTSAKIRVSIIPASDRYQDFLLLHGLIIGSVIALSLWDMNRLLPLPCFLGVQLLSILAFDAIKPLRHLSRLLTPRSVLHRRAARKAFHLYHEHAAAFSPEQPIAFLFISLAERSVRVITNPALHRHIPDAWDQVIAQFVAQLRKKGIDAACLEAIAHVGEILAGSRR